MIYQRQSPGKDGVCKLPFLPGSVSFIQFYPILRFRLSGETVEKTDTSVLVMDSFRNCGYDPKNFLVQSFSL